MKVSLFHFCGVGYAAENLKLGERILEVAPLELFPTVDGEITAEQFTVTTSGITGDKTDYSDKANISYSVPATWLGGGYQVTPPNVRRSERVALYKLGDGPKLYWRSLGMDNDKRRLETVVLAISAVPDNSDIDEFNPENCYFLEISSHKKLITFATSMMNNEKAGFTFQINTGEGLIIFEDDKGNNFTHDSVNTHYSFKNVDGLSIDLLKKDMTVVVPENVKMDCKNLTVTVGEAIDVKAKTFSMDASDSVTVSTKATTIKSSNTINFETKVFEAAAGGNATIKAPKILLDGIVNCTQSLTAVGPVTGAALAIAAGGGMSEDGTLTAKKAEVTEASIGAVTADTVQAGIVAGDSVTSGGRVVLTS